MYFGYVATSGAAARAGVRRRRARAPPSLVIPGSSPELPTRYYLLVRSIVAVRSGMQIHALDLHEYRVLNVCTLQ